VCHAPCSPGIPDTLRHVVLVFLILLRQYVVVAADDDPTIVQQKSVLDETLDRFRFVHGNQPAIVQSLTTIRNRNDSRYSRKKRKKGKEEYLYSAFLRQGTHKALRHGSHLVLPANITMPAFPSWRSPDVTTTATEAEDIQLQLTTHLSTPKG